MELMNGRKTFTPPQFKALENPESAEAREIFRQAEQDNLRECLDRVLYNYSRCGANKKDLNDAGFDNLVIYNGNKNQVELNRLSEKFVETLVNDPEFNKVFILNGNPGMGKTYYALSMIKMLCAKPKPRIYIKKETVNEEGQTEHILEDANVTDFYRGYYITSEDYCALVTGKGLTASSPAKAGATIDKLKNCKLLVIDELGRAILNAKVEKDSIFHIVNYRINNYLPTVLCTNFSEEGLHKAFGDAFYNRLKAYGIWFCCDGMENMRSQAAQKVIREKRNEKRNRQPQV